jgi:hypothetical protein
MVKNPSYLVFAFQFKIYAEFLVGPYSKIVED